MRQSSWIAATTLTTTLTGIATLMTTLTTACGSAPAPGPTTPPPATTAPPVYATHVLPLPGATADGVGMDYLLYDAHTNAVWVPAGNTGSVDVIDAATGALTRIAGFPTQEVERKGAKRVVGPSSAALGDGVVYIGNRGDSSVCAVDDGKLVKGTCVTLDAMPDGIAYVAATREVWVTTPRDKSLRILDATTLVQKARVELAEGPEGVAVDDAHGRFYTNFEDSDATVAIDVVTHAVVATWKDHCGGDGPRGLRVAAQEGFVLVACHASTEALAIAHDGAVVGTVATGEGVDDLDYAPATHRLYAAASSGSLTIAAVDASGALSLVASVPTADGARNAVVTRDGAVYVAHGKAGELVVVAPK